MRLLQFTDRQGRALWIHPDHIILVRAIGEGEAAYKPDRALTALSLSESGGSPIIVVGDADDLAERISRQLDPTL